jgi:hypothetical protein
MFSNIKNSLLLGLLNDRCKKCNTETYSLECVECPVDGVKNKAIDENNSNKKTMTCLMCNAKFTSYSVFYRHISRYKNYDYKNRWGWREKCSLK